MEKKFIQNEIEGKNGWRVWKVIGRIDTQTADEAYAFGEEIVKKNLKVVLDMSEMDYMSSAGLRVLLRLSKLASQSDGTFVVTGPTGMVKNLLEDSSMDVLLNMSESLDDLT